MRIAMIAITTNNSISVNPGRFVEGRKPAMINPRKA
jgi:hypothetical protein